MAKKKIEEVKTLNKEQLAILASVIKNIFYFSTFIKVVNPVKGVVPFDLYPFQKSVLLQFLKQRFNIILKFRQAGITELISMYALWLAMYYPNKKIIIISIKDNVAKKVLKKIKFMYKNLPWYLQTPIINGRAGDLGSATLMEFSNGSTIESIPTSEQAGRSEAVSLLIIDEAAMVRWAATIAASAIPSLSCAIYETPILIRKKQKVKEVPLGTLCPVKKGVEDISDKGLYTLTHKGKWKLITHGVNKGKLETWYVKDEKGKIGGYTPKHRLYTTEGWRTVEEIIKEDLYVIQAETKVDELIKPITVKKPNKKVTKPIKGFPDFFIDNFGVVYKRRPNGNITPVPQRATKDGYLRVGLTNVEKRKTGSPENRAKSKIFQRAVSKLVYETFIGDIPEGYQVDHINNIRTINHVNNLRLITPSENVKKSFEQNLGAKLSHISGQKMPDLKNRGLILKLYREGNTFYKIAKELYPGRKDKGKTIKRLLLERESRIYISKLEVVDKTVEPIYDISVEDDHSYISANNYINHNTGGQFIVNSCITGDTEIIGRHGNFRVEQICPKEVGYQDVRFMDLYVLTHKLKWRKVLYGVNKGNLETWRLQTENGNEIKCTPAHKFLTPYGWKSAEYCIKHGLPIITYESGLASLEDHPITVPPKQEVIVPVPGFENYLITTHGRVLYKDTLKPKKLMTNKDGYYRVKLWNNNQMKNFTISKLVAETFLGPIPQGYVVDHINCIKTDNYITNLQIISTSENSKRATKYSRNLVLNNNTGAGASDIRLVGYIRYKFLQGLSPDSIIKRAKRWFNKDINRAYISQVVNGRRCTGIQLSKLRLLEKYSDTIYDLTVEGDESYITPNGFISHNTPLGMANWYHSTWVDAVGNANGFNPIRLYWDMHPERDINWYNEMSKALGPKRTAQEIDGDFLSSGNMVFEASDIKAIEESLYEYPVIKRRLNGQFLQFLEPEKDEEYYIGADIATGRATDYSSFTCMNGAGEEYVVFKGKIPINKFTRLLGDTGERFNYAKLGPETNDIGMAVTMALQDEGYPNLYHHRKFLKKKGSRKKEVELIPGWLTTSKNRSLIIEGLEKDIREDEIIIKDPFFVSEAYTFIYDGQGRPVAMGKHKNKNSSVDIDLEGETYADDDIFGKAITNHMRKYSKIESITVMPQ